MATYFDSRNARKRAGEYLSDAGDDLSDRLDAAVSAINELTDTVSGGSSRAMSRARKSGRRAYKYSEDTIQDYPFSSVGIALGIGVAIGALLGLAAFTGGDGRPWGEPR